MSDEGNAAQIRVVAEQIADAAIVRFTQHNPGLLRDPPAKAEIPAPLKWGAGLFGAVLVLAASSGLLWLVSTVNTMQVTLARMDERMTTGSIKDNRFDDLERRVQTNESKITELMDSKEKSR